MMIMESNSHIHFHLDPNNVGLEAGHRHRHRGRRGLRGFQGDTGVQGPDGNPGFNGNKGSPGNKGPDGETGVQGPTGVSGGGGIPADITVSTITLGTGGYLQTSDSTGYVKSATFEGYPGNDLNIYAASGNGFYLTGGATSGNNSLVNLNTNGSLELNATAAGGATNGVGLIVGTEGKSLAFPQDPLSTFGVGAITNLSTINGAAYPPVGVPSVISVSTIVLEEINFNSKVITSDRPGLWVAVGNDSSSQPKNTIEYSADGSNWSSAVTGGFNDGQGNGVAYGNGLWIAVGNSKSGVSPIQYSGDASNWSNSIVNHFDGQAYGVAYGSNKWVAVGAAPTPLSTIQYSGDGSNWSNAGKGGFINGGLGIAYGTNMWVAVGNTGVSGLSTIQYSGDGCNWSNSTKNSFSTGGVGIAYGNGLWVAVGDDTAIEGTIKYSGDGSNWSNAEKGGFTDGMNRIGKGVAYGNGLWVAVGYQTTVLDSIQYSGDGCNWSNAQSGGFDNYGNFGNGIAWGNGLWAATGDGSGKIQYSSNGSDWYPSVTNNFYSSGYGVAYRPGGPYEWNINLSTNLLTIDNSVNTVKFTNTLMTNLSTLSISAYPPAIRAGIFTLTTNSTNSYYEIINPPDGITNNAVVLCSLTKPDSTTGNVIVYSDVQPSLGGGAPWYIHVVMATAVTDSTSAVAWQLVLPNCTLGTSVSTIT